ncbi:hypothetical protein ACOMHN_027940 [Nucella lapillus]
MASSRRNPWNGGEIDDLPAEILSYDIKEIPRSTLKDIANKLNADTISAGNWETLAEKLGFTKNSILENLTQQAKVQNTYPGLLMLQEWSRRSGSTAHVLLHALREIQREDAVVVLVEKLFELHIMQLLVKVEEERGGGSPKFLRVPTQKSAPLHASLDNTLQKPPYWYDIVGPRCDITWDSPSGILQVGLGFGVPSAPDSNMYDTTYCTSTRCFQGTQLSLRLRVQPNESSMSIIYGTSPQFCQSPPSLPLALNIPPDPHLPHKFPLANGKSMLNNLSNHPQSVSATACEAATVQPHSHASLMYSFQPMTNIDGTPQCQSRQPFPNFDTLMSSGFELSAPPISVSSLQESVESMEYNPSSCTGVKMPIVPHCAQEHDETLLKERVEPVHEIMNIPVAEKSSPEEMSMGPAEHGEMGLAEGVQFSGSSKSPTTASSFMHAKYVSHEAIIHFCNNPTSPQSLDSNSPLGSAGGTNVRSQFVLEFASADQTCSAGQQQQSPSPDQNRRFVNPGEYVPVTFLENMGKTSQGPGLNEEENMQTEYSNDPRPTNEIGRESGLQQELDTYRLAVATSTSDYTNMNNGKPKPCTYTMYRPGDDTSPDFPPRPVLPHSVSMGSDPGYMDMQGAHSTPSQHHRSPASSATALAAMHSSMSVDSYMNTQADLGLQNPGEDPALDTSSRSIFIPNLDPRLLSRSRNPLPAGGDVFQPRDRRPLTQAHELLLEDPEPEYTYIDAASVSPQADLHRRSSEGSLSSEGGGASYPSGGSRAKMLRHRRSNGKVDLRGSVFPAELLQVPGWNANITEKTVDHEMSRYINDDGNFVVWRYDVGDKYVISVSHLRMIRHYAVYESERDRQVYYYIFPKGQGSTSLAGLVRHLQEHGVTETTKTFKTPDGKQAHRSSKAGGGFSHVRLKFPIPARRN